MIFVLWAAVCLTAALMMVRFGRVSAVSVGFVGLLAYSLPALVGVTKPVLTERMVGYLEPASDQAILVMAVAWAGFAASLYISAVGGFFRLKTPVPHVAPLPQHLNRFLLIAGFITVALFFSVSRGTGFMWFLQARADVAAEIGVEWLLWKWTLSLGFLAAWYHPAPFVARAFFTSMLLIVSMNDRTTPVIVLVSLAAACNWGRPLRSVIFTPKALAAATTVVSVILFGKLLVTSLKSDISFFDLLMASDPMAILAGWEAFGTHQLLETAVALNVSYPLWDTVRDSLAQFLVMPSAFGFDSRGYNEMFQTQIFSEATYGLASNLWAHSWSAAGIPGVFVAGHLFGFALLAADKMVARSTSMAFFMFILIASTIGIYAHRNSPENLLAILRPIVLVYVLVQLIDFFAPGRHQKRYAPGRHQKTIRA
ncbi:hypothetical protein [Mesorhizobium sp.]|uniref:hypothetical protein n=1 Tax=Mesorhizobium sp. TaxID=1871066 RepID=UPI0011F5A6CB|nr:hypothetical protein [Mesorhizobium sp.]TIN11645.1 MAG: hypothetical protein E5Y14_04800 [Mesorhizobium sp.]